MDNASMEHWNNGIKAFVLGRRLERNAPEASVGFPLGYEGRRSFPPEEAGVLARPIYGEISAL